MRWQSWDIFSDDNDAYSDKNDDDSDNNDDDSDDNVCDADEVDAHRSQHVDPTTFSGFPEVSRHIEKPRLEEKHEADPLGNKIDYCYFQKEFLCTF